MGVKPRCRHRHRQRISTKNERDLCPLHWTCPTNRSPRISAQQQTRSLSQGTHIRSTVCQVCRGSEIKVVRHCECLISASTRDRIDVFPANSYKWPSFYVLCKIWTSALIVPPHHTDIVAGWVALRSLNTLLRNRSVTDRMIRKHAFEV